MKRPAAKGPRCPCGTWLPVKHRGVRRFCAKHSLQRAHRVDGRLFNRDGGVKLSLGKVPLPHRKKYEKLFAKWNDLDSGCDIVAHAWWILYWFTGGSH